METFKMKIAGLERELPIFKVNDNVSIAAFILFGDVEITIASARELLKKCPEFDVIITPEAKSISLAYEMSRQSGKKFIVARKGVKVYMENPISVEVQSITTKKLQQLFIGQQEINDLKGKKVLIVDDVISTGESLLAVQKLVEKAGGNVVASCAVLAEGNAAKRHDIIYLEPLPLL
jgi:adenine phosphoribosyltransferase